MSASDANDIESKISALSEIDRARLELMTGGVQEVVGLEHLVNCLSGKPTFGGDNTIRCYVGIEPSGKAHIGWKVLSLQMRKMLDANANVIIFLADWHAWVNDKFKGDLESIQTTARYMEDTFRALLHHPPEGDGPGQLQFVWASNIMDSMDYWARVLRCSKGATLAMVRKTFTIMGRDEASSDHDLSRFYYPAMQAADIFEMNIDVAIGGMDQRKAHMYMRDVASKYGWKKATCFHTHIISSLKSTGVRMESFDHKMSKSEPNAALILHDTPEQIRKKMRKAYLDPSDENSPVYELVEHVVLPEFGVVEVRPDPKSGTPSDWTNHSDFKQAVMSGELHPLDAKFAVADGLAKGLENVADYFAKHPELLNKVTSFVEK